ncbi:MAG TPA: hypothetical protein VHB79_10335 [Polyangiaceae bacterium]|nr:hypothetical protein [Polyangiaceae bacterium]
MAYVAMLAVTALAWWLRGLDAAGYTLFACIWAVLLTSALPLRSAAQRAERG